MPENKMEWAYETMTGYVMEGYRMPGVEDAFAEGSFCMNRYCEAMEAYENLRKRLGVIDEDADVERMICAFEDIQEELCYRMYRCGAEFGDGNKC